MDRLGEIATPVNEKGAVQAAGLLPGAPAEFTARAHATFSALNATPDTLAAALNAADRLTADYPGRPRPPVMSVEPT